MTAMMVIGNIETFAASLEKNAIRMGWNDTLATYLLSYSVSVFGVLVVEN